MKTKYKFIAILFFFIGLSNYAQTARVKGLVLDENNVPVENVNVTYLDKATNTNENGFYELTIPANKKVTIIFSHVSLKKTTATLQLKPNEDYEFNVVLNEKA